MAPGKRNWPGYGLSEAPVISIRHWSLAHYRSIVLAYTLFLFYLSVFAPRFPWSAVPRHLPLRTRIVRRSSWASSSRRPRVSYIVLLAVLRWFQWYRNRGILSCGPQDGTWGGVHMTGGEREKPRESSSVVSWDRGDGWPSPSGTAPALGCSRILNAACGGHFSHATTRRGPVLSFSAEYQMPPQILPA